MPVAPEPRVGVVGHVELVEFARVARVPCSGEIVHASETWVQAAGGGAVAAVQLAKLAGESDFFTALGDDTYAVQALASLRQHERVRLHESRHARPQRRALTFLEPSGERTITILGARLLPRGKDPLPWARLGDLDGVYFTGGDVAALRAARGAAVLVATPRVMSVLADARVRIDALVASASDPGERFESGMLDPPPQLVVRTRGDRGGEWTAEDSTSGSWVASPAPAPVSDAYGCGDSFAAGLTYALAAGRKPQDAVQLAARCGAACLTGRGPYAGQLTR